MAGRSSRLAPLITSFPLQVSMTLDMSQTDNGTLFGLASLAGKLHTQASEERLYETIQIFG